MNEKIGAPFKKTSAATAVLILTTWSLVGCGGASNGDATPAVGQVAIPQSIQFSVPAKMNVNGNVVLMANASSGLPVSYEAATPKTCSVVGNALQALAIGTCTLTASQMGNGKFAPALPVSQTINIDLAQQSIQFSSELGLNVSSSVGLTATASSNLPVTYATTTPAVCSISGSSVTALAVAGTCNVIASQTGNATTYAAAQPISKNLIVYNPTLLLTAQGAEAYPLLAQAGSTAATVATNNASPSVAGMYTLSNGSIALVSPRQDIVYYTSGNGVATAAPKFAYGRLLVSSVNLAAADANNTNAWRFDGTSKSNLLSNAGEATSETSGGTFVEKSSFTPTDFALNAPIQDAATNLIINPSLIYSINNFLAVPQSALTGTWTQVSSGRGTTTNLSILSNGTLTGTHRNCTLSGTALPADNVGQKNMFNVQFSATGPTTCTLSKTKPYTGLLVVTLLPAGSVPSNGAIRYLTVIANTESGDAFEYFRIKK